MRILVAHHHRTVLGGIETYLAAIVPRLAEAGHELLFAHEAAADNGYPILDLPPGIESVSLERGISAAMEKIRAWRPDVAYAHALHVPEFQRAVVEEFPTVLFAHGYYGLCISGSKTWQRGEPTPCGKAFGWKCLLHFHARGCGGSNPLTMWRDYQLHTRQLETLKKCRAVLTHGGLMEREYIAAGLEKQRVYSLPHFVPQPTLAPKYSELGRTARLIYVGRFDSLKGGNVLLEALPIISSDLDRPVELKMVGAGPMAAQWKQVAQRVSSATIAVEFTGWAERAEKDRLISESDLLVMPSVWPEPFGQAGLEAASLGVPAVGFAVGGIPVWLRDSISGYLAPADPPTVAGLADAVAKALGKPEHYAKLRAGALAVAREFSIEKHMTALVGILEKVAASR